MKTGKDSSSEEKERLQKVLARLGVASRREVERWITAGRITVNGKIATIGTSVNTALDAVSIDGRPRKLDRQITRQVLAYNKPEGEICTRSDPEGRTSVFSKLPKPDSGRWISIGRLDINTSGLLLFTNDGELARRLMHPSYQVDREYAVRVFGQVQPEHLQAMTRGVKLEDGEARFSDIVESGGDGINRWFHVCLQEGRNREVRRLWESQGVSVNRLKRVRYGAVIIPDHLRTGRYQLLEDTQVEKLTASVNLKSSPPPAGRKKYSPSKGRQKNQASHHKPDRDDISPRKSPRKPPRKSPRKRQ